MQSALDVVGLVEALLPPVDDFDIDTGFRGYNAETPLFCLECDWYGIEREAKFVGVAGCCMDLDLEPGKDHGTFKCPECGGVCMPGDE